MKVVWICNVPNRDACLHMNRPIVNRGGWLTGLSKAMRESNEVELVYCYPAVGQRNQDNYVMDGVHYYSFYTPKMYGIINIDSNKDSYLEREHIRNIFMVESPDIIHIFGTEYMHSLIAAEEAENKGMLVCSIQGLTSFYYEHMCAYIPDKWKASWNASCLVRGTIRGQRNALKKRGDIEKKTLDICQNVIGRTEWDESCTYYINRHRRYFYAGETMRESFYSGKWEYEKCEKHSLFMSQASSPLKGLNILLKAVGLLACDYPDIRLYIAGNQFARVDGFIRRLKISTYGSHIKKLIEELDLSDKVIFIGELDEEGVKEYLQRANVFVSPSSIENSSNSLSEAMLQGIPVVSSYVGGIPSLISDNKEGLFYQGDAYYMCARMISKIFNDRLLAERLGNNARNKARLLFDPKMNNEYMLDVYRKIAE